MDGALFRMRLLGTIEITDRQGVVVDRVQRQPKRLALLVYLASRRQGSRVRRTELHALFWPELDEEHARNALNKALHFLRRALAPTIVTSHGRTEVVLDTSLLSSDAVALREQLASGPEDRALHWYAGEFLPGLHVDDAPGFQEWLERERAWYRAQASAAGLRLLNAALERGRLEAALEWCGVLARVAPHEEAVVRATVQTHLRAGDRAGALERLEEYEEWLKDHGGTGVPARLLRLLAEAAPSGADEPTPELLAASRAATRVETLEEYREFVEQLPDMCYRCDLRGSFPFVNGLVVQTFGWSRQELREKPYYDLVREDFRDSVIEFYLRQVSERIPVTELEFPAVTKHGREIWVRQRVRLLERDGVPVGVEAVARDVSTRVRRERTQRRALLEDRETRLLNLDAFLLAAGQRIKLNRRSGEPFFLLHVHARPPEIGEGQSEDETTEVRMRVVAAVVRRAVRESDVVARLGTGHLAVLAPAGGGGAAEVVRERVEEALAQVTSRGELKGRAVSVTAVVHDSAGAVSAEALVRSAPPLEP